MKIPTYKGSFLFGATAEIQANPLAMYHKAHQQLGPAVRIRTIPGYDFYSFTDPDAIEHVLRSHSDNYVKPDIFLKAMVPLTGRGLFTNEDHADWQKQRRLMSPVFHNKRIAGMTTTMVEETENVARAWEAKASSGTPVIIQEEMKRLTLNIVSRTLFSTDVMSGAREITSAVETAFNYAGFQLNNPFSFSEMILGRQKRKFKKAYSILNETVMKMIRERQASGNLGDDMLGLLLSGRDEESGKGMDLPQLRDEVMTLMIAGHETTAAALSWAWYLLAQNPDIADKLAALSAGYDPLTGGEMPVIPDYARMVFEETMRLYPPAWGVPRFSLAPDTVNGSEIKGKKIVTLFFYGTHRDPKIWDKPEMFMPGRFVPEEVEKRHRHAYLPFGLGKRRCIGSNMAMLEGPLILAILGHRFRLRLEPGQEPVGNDPTFALWPGKPLRMQVTKRT